jgi:fucose 4-O-acetylase-like acetyltransferase
VLNFQLHGLQIDMRVNRINNYFYFYISAFSGIVAMVCLSYLINKNTLLEYIGKRTMILFAWHYIIFLCITKLTDAMISVDFAPVKIFFPAVYTIIATCIILSFNYLTKRINRHLSASHTK